MLLPFQRFETALRLPHWIRHGTAWCIAVPSGTLLQCNAMHMENSGVKAAMKGLYQATWHCNTPCQIWCEGTFTTLSMKVLSPSSINSKLSTLRHSSHLNYIWFTQWLPVPTTYVFHGWPYMAQSDTGTSMYACVSLTTWLHAVQIVKDCLIFLQQGC